MVEISLTSGDPQKVKGQGQTLTTLQIEYLKNGMR